MAWNPDYLQRYEDDMREKHQQQEVTADRENNEHELQRLRHDNAELRAKLQSQCSHNWLGGYCDLCGAIKGV